MPQDNWFIAPGDFVLDDPLLEPHAFFTATGIIDKPKKPRSEEELFIAEIQFAIEDGDPIKKTDMARYLKLTRKKRHINRMERAIIHNPGGDGDKTTANLEIDDIVNIPLE